MTWNKHLQHLKTFIQLHSPKWSYGWINTAGTALKADFQTSLLYTAQWTFKLRGHSVILVNQTWTSQNERYLNTYYPKCWCISMLSFSWALLPPLRIKLITGTSGTSVSTGSPCLRCQHCFRSLLFLSAVGLGWGVRQIPPIGCLGVEMAPWACRRTSRDFTQ